MRKHPVIILGGFQKQNILTGESKIGPKVRSKVQHGLRVREKWQSRKL